ncbi:MAG TPA: hypothetical protein VK698_08375 [Kofleriaceae bacterium]|nr:hypothetical protein [Kofleriaceae bacterium]
MLRAASVAALLLACGGRQVETTTETVDFYGVVVDVPKGTSSASTATSSPLNIPGAQGVTPGIVLIHPGTGDFHVEVQKLPSALSVDDMKATLAALPAASRIEGRVTDGGWAVEYGWKNEGAPPARVYLRYRHIGAEHYQCQYDDGGTEKLDVAEAICHSLRPRPGAK